LERTGDEGRAIWEANAVVARQAEARYLTKALLGAESFRRGLDLYFERH
jgi:hypothetical protein